MLRNLGHLGVTHSVSFQHIVLWPERRFVFILYFFVNWLSIVIIPKIINLWRKDWFGLMVSVHAQLAPWLWSVVACTTAGAYDRDLSPEARKQSEREEGQGSPHFLQGHAITQSSFYVVSPLQSPANWGARLGNHMVSEDLNSGLQAPGASALPTKPSHCSGRDNTKVFIVHYKGKHKPQNLPLKLLSDLPGLRIYWSD